MSMRPQSNTTVVRGAVLAAVLLVLGGALFWRIRNDSGSTTANPKTEVPVAGSTVVSGEGTSAPGVEPTPAPTVAAPNPATINVMVANAAKVKGAASRVQSDLQAKGFVSLGTTNAKTVQQTSQVLYQGDQVQNATYVATLLGIPAEAVLPATTMPQFTSAIGPEVGVIVIIGKDLAQPAG
jgi:LytR cell envelope-related transcriptional attenuator